MHPLEHNDTTCFIFCKLNKMAVVIYDVSIVSNSKDLLLHVDYFYLHSLAFMLFYFLNALIHQSKFLLCKNLLSNQQFNCFINFN